MVEAVGRRAVFGEAPRDWTERREFDWPCEPARGRRAFHQAPRLKSSAPLVPLRSRACLIPVILSLILARLYPIIEHSKPLASIRRTTPWVFSSCNGLKGR